MPRDPNDRPGLIADDWEELVNRPGELAWTTAAHAPPETREYLKLLEDAHIAYEMADRCVRGTYLFRIRWLEHPEVHYLVHDPGTRAHMWADEGFHNALDNDRLGWEMAAQTAGFEIIEVLPGDDT